MEFRNLHFLLNDMWTDWSITTYFNSEMEFRISFMTYCTSKKGKVRAVTLLYYLHNFKCRIHFAEHQHGSRDTKLSVSIYRGRFTASINITGSELMWSIRVYKHKKNSVYYITDLPPEHTHTFGIYYHLYKDIKPLNNFHLRLCSSRFHWKHRFIRELCKPIRTSELNTVLLSRSLFPSPPKLHQFSGY